MPRGSKAKDAMKKYREAMGGKGKSTKALTKPAATAVAKIARRVVKGQAETKSVTFWSGPAGGVSAPGTWPPTGYNFSPQNQNIQNNGTDIHRLLPRVFLGTGDTQRTGNTIKPVSLLVKGTVALNPIFWSSGNIPPPNDLTAVLYVLQHVNLRNYIDLSNNNNFFQMLHTGDQGVLDAAGTALTTQVPTTAFSGFVHHSQMPVSKQYYKLVKKKIFRLTSSGAQPVGGLGPPPPVAVTVLPMTVKHSFSFELNKAIPKTLKYPEITPSVPTQANNAYDPTNTSLFMCVGFYDTKGVSLGAQGQSLIALQYEATLKYKDM